MDFGKVLFALLALLLVSPAAFAAGNYCAADAPHASLAVKVIGWGGGSGAPGQVLLEEGHAIKVIGWGDGGA